MKRARKNEVLSNEMLHMLYELVCGEAKLKLNEEIFGELVDGAKLVKLRRREAMIEAGTFDPSLYIVKSGLIRATYMDCNLERTVGFALPGTVLLSFHCYYGGKPSFYRYEACEPTDVLRVQMSTLNRLLKREHHLAFWLMQVHQNQIYHSEIKHKLVSGDAKEKLAQLISGWPEIFNRVPSKYIASYLGMTEVHLSRVKADMLKSVKI